MVFEYQPREIDQLSIPDIFISSSARYSDEFRDMRVGRYLVLAALMLTLASTPACSNDTSDSEPTQIQMTLQDQTQIEVTPIQNAVLLPPNLSDVELTQDQLAAMFDSTTNVTDAGVTVRYANLSRTSVGIDQASINGLIDAILNSTYNMSSSESQPMLQRSTPRLNVYFVDWDLDGAAATTMQDLNNPDSMHIQLSLPAIAEQYRNLNDIMYKKTGKELSIEQVIAVVLCDEVSNSFTYKRDPSAIRQQDEERLSFDTHLACAFASIGVPYDEYQLKVVSIGIPAGYGFSATGRPIDQPSYDSMIATLERQELFSLN